MVMDGVRVWGGARCLNTVQENRLRMPHATAAACCRLLPLAAAAAPAAAVAVSFPPDEENLLHDVLCRGPVVPVTGKVAAKAVGRGGRQRQLLGCMFAHPPAAAADAMGTPTILKRPIAPVRNNRPAVLECVCWLGLNVALYRYGAHRQWLLLVRLKCEWQFKDQS